MKNFKLMSLMLALMACTFTFVACGDDDDEEGVNVTTSQLTGTWEMTHIAGWFLTEDDNEKLVKVSVDMDVNENTLEDFFDKDFADFVRYKFTENMFTSYQMEYYGGSWEESQTVPYVVNGSIITINPKGRNEEQFTVLNISATQLVLKMVEEGELDMKVTFKKIN